MKIATIFLFIGLIFPFAHAQTQTGQVKAGLDKLRFYKMDGSKSSLKTTPDSKYITRAFVFEIVKGPFDGPGGSLYMIKMPDGAVGVVSADGVEVHKREITKTRQPSPQNYRSAAELTRSLVASSKTPATLLKPLWNAKPEIQRLSRPDRMDVGVAIINSGVSMDGELADVFADCFGSELLDHADTIRERHRRSQQPSRPMTKTAPAQRSQISVGENVASRGAHTWSGKVISVNSNGTIRVRLTYVADSGLSPKGWKSGMEVTLTDGEYYRGTKRSGSSILNMFGGGR